MNFNVKRYINAVMCSMLLGLAFSTTACSKDNDESNEVPELGTPKYEAESAKYLISNQNAGIESIEFTSAGNYIITTDNYGSYRATAPSKSSHLKKSSLLRKMGDMTRASNFNGIISGTYTINSNGTYVLEGFGTITITTVDGSYLLNIRTNEGETLDLNATKGAEIGNSAITQAICRTWNVDGYRWFVQVGKRVIFDQTAPKSDVKKLLKNLMDAMKDFDDDEDDEDWDMDDEAELNATVELLQSVNQIIFSKSGTYMVTYVNNQLAISTWAWADENKGIIRYSWDYSDIDNDDFGGFATLTFNGNKLNVTESLLDEDEDEDDDYPVRFEMTYILSEAK